ncbi:Kinesin-like protein KIN-4C [Cardamine amara subsp. amara]|uniref:Kinesin-like protein KIN-4C n=1 Tax=Cardamine amara subsp. amara TaxID=228776 RepID=A0ABD1ALT4_CARAN
MTKRNLRSKKSSVGNDSEQRYEKKIRDLETVNESLKCDVEELRSKLADVSINSSAGTLQSSREFSHKSIATKEQGMSSRSKSNLHSMCSTKKYKTESSVKQVDGEVRKLKAQKVKLQCKIKLDSMHFRLLKASLEKEVLQLKKELRKSEFEKHVLSALNSRQKLILQLKNTQALTALKRLKLLLQSKKTSSNKNNGPPKGTSSRIQESNDESRLLMKLNKIHSDYERQMKEIAEEVKKFSLEADELKAEFEGEQNSFSASSDNRINHTPMDSELKELKEEFNKLSTLVSQMEMTKSQVSETDKIQDELAKHSVSSNITNDETVVEPSQLKISEETLCNTNDQSNLEPSGPKTSEETLCKPAESSVSSKNTNDQSNMESSELKTSEEPVCKKEQSKDQVCCSCTKKSLCKTKNCKCRANGSGCGDSCGCVAAKCSNREEIIRPNKSMEPAAGISHDDRDAKKQPLRDIGNIREAEKVGKVKKVLKPVVKKTK